MRKRAYVLASLAIAVGLAGCGAQEEGGEISAAREVSEIPITTASEEARAYYLEGQALLDAGRALEARAAFRLAAQKDPKFARAYLGVANTAVSNIEFKEFMDLAMANADGVSEGEKLLIEINMTFFENDADRRHALANELVEKYPASPRAWLALGGVQTGLDQNEGARASMNRGLALDPNLAAGYTQLGFSYLFSEPKDFGKAAQSMGRAVELMPEEASAHVNLGDVYRASQDLEGAREEYATASELDPENGVALVKKGHVNSFLGNYDEARGDYDRSLEVAKVEQRAFYAPFRAYIHIHAGDAEAAIAELGSLVENVEKMGTPAEQVNGAKMNALTNIAMIALQYGKFDLAEHALEKRAELGMAIALEVGAPAGVRGQEANIAYWNGILAARKGDYRAAKMAADENAQLLEPDNNPRKLEPYHDLLGLTALLQGNYAEAVDHYQQANPNNIYTRFHLGLAYEGLGYTDEAQQIFREVYEFNFNNLGYALVRKEAKGKMMQRVSQAN